MIDRTVTGNESITDDNEIMVGNITVRNGANLTLRAPKITINEPFTVENGGGLVLENVEHN